VSVTNSAADRWRYLLVVLQVCRSNGYIRNRKISEEVPLEWMNIFTDINKEDLV